MAGTVQVKFTTLSTEQVRAIAAHLSQCRDLIPTYNHGGSIAEHWEPTVRCEGPSAWGLTTPKIPASVAAGVARIVDGG